MPPARPGAKLIREFGQCTGDGGTREGQVRSWRQIGGYFTSWPANVWLVKRGIKVPM
jgi:hypothetical protein